MRLKKKLQTIRQLSDYTKIPCDDVMFCLWENGIEYPLTPSSVIKYEDLQRAQKALGIVSAEEISTLKYWGELFGFTRPQLAEFLTQLGMPITESAFKVPKGGVSKLKTAALRVGICPITGRIKRTEILKNTQLEILEPSKPEDPLFWRSVGHHRDPISLLNEEDVIKIHHELVNDFSSSEDPIFPYGIKNNTLLASALFRPQTNLGRNLKYPTVEMSAAALLHALIQNHAFHNGNKRTALVSMLVMMDRNGFMLTCKEEDLFKMVLLVSSHKIITNFKTELADREALSISEWLCGNSRLIDKSVRPVPWRRLKSILQSFNCRIESSKSGGRRIIRELKGKNFIGFSKTTQLDIQLSFGEYDGRDVQIPTIKKIRENLKLDEKNGIDSQMFYGKDSEQPIDFILRYRKTLNRLAKV